MYGRTQRLVRNAQYRGMQSKRQDTTSIVIPCLYSFLLTVPSSAFSEPPVNKKRTQTLSHREPGSSTNWMVDGTGLEPVTSCTSSRCSTSWANRPYFVLPKSAWLYYHTFWKKASLFSKNVKLFWKRGGETAFCAAERRILWDGIPAFGCSHSFVVI